MKSRSFQYLTVKLSSIPHSTIGLGSGLVSLHANRDLHEAPSNDSDHPTTPAPDLFVYFPSALDRPSSNKNMAPRKPAYLPSSSTQAVPADESEAQSLMKIAIDASPLSEL